MEEADVRSWVSRVDTVEGPLLTRGFCFVVLYKADLLSSSEPPIAALLRFTV